MRPRIFVGSSGERIQVCLAIQEELDRDFDVTVWDQDVFRIAYDALDSLLDRLDSSDAGVFVLAPDDLTIIRGESSPTTRDNVVLELGMFLGRLGRDRTFMVSPKPFTGRLPTDLAGVTTAGYDADRFSRGEGRAAVGPACTKIRDRLVSVQPRMAPEPRSQARLDTAMRRMSRDLEYLLADQGRAARRRRASALPQPPVHLSLTLGRATVQVEAGRIQDYESSDPRSVIALPANEYFDDECIFDTNSSLGAFVQQRFRDNTGDFVQRVRQGLIGVPSQRVPRAERRIDESYGIGQSVFLNMSGHRLILVSATTERTGIGLRAEPHFLYAAVESVIETMNERRLESLTMPVLGSGHGGMPLPIATLFNLLAVRSLVTEDIGRHLREIRIVVFDRHAVGLSPTTMQDIASHVAPT